MNLTIKERLSILQILPESGSLSDMVDIMEIVKKVRITQEEKTKVEYRETSGAITWNISKDEGADIDFTFEELSILKKAVSKVDKEGRVNMSNLDICLKINSL